MSKPHTKDEPAPPPAAQRNEPAPPPADPNDAARVTAAAVVAREKALARESLKARAIPRESRKAGHLEGDYRQEPGRKLDLQVYLKQLSSLNVELVKLQEWIKARGLKVVVLFEGRDAAGKGGAIKTITAPLNPRVCRVVALGTPTDREKTQWYFQRYVAQLPAAGEMVLFDRSWYNRAGVEHVMGFCSQDEYDEFLRLLPRVRADAHPVGHRPDQVLVLGRRRRTGEALPGPHQATRPSTGRSRRWTSCPGPSGSSTRAPRTPCSRRRTSPRRPWWVVSADDKKRARLNSIRHLLRHHPLRGTASNPGSSCRRDRSRMATFGRHFTASISSPREVTEPAVFWDRQGVPSRRDRSAVPEPHRRRGPPAPNAAADAAPRRLHAVRLGGAHLRAALGRPARAGLHRAGPTGPSPPCGCSTGRPRPGAASAGAGIHRRLVGELPAILDGELVVPDRIGRMDDDALAGRLADGQTTGLEPGLSGLRPAVGRRPADHRPAAGQAPRAPGRRSSPRARSWSSCPGSSATAWTSISRSPSRVWRGVMARHLRSPYLPGSRSDLWRWIANAARRDAAPLAPRSERGPPPRPVLALIQRLPLED